MPMIHTNICIVGAGPGGVGTALKLSYLGIPCVLIDKAIFPRDKICGDAISGKVTTLLNRIDPAILKRFNAKPLHADVWGMRFVAPNNQLIDIPFKPNYERNAEAAPGYVAKRMDFDHFLVEEVKRRKNIQFFEGVEIQSFEALEEGGYHLVSKDKSLKIQAKILIVANGAHSTFSRHQAGLERDLAHHAGAVRAYYRGVKGMNKDNFIELHFIKSIVPGYFWIFPLPNGEANVGLGMRSDYISKKKVNLRKCLEDIIANHPDIKGRFAEAERIDSVRGYGLPLGSKTRLISGDHYMLVGDAGHLIDPLTGEGIGNAFYSGVIAAEQAQKCLELNEFSAKFMQAYDVRVQRVLGTEMKLSYRLQKILRYPIIVNIIARIIASNQKILSVFSKMYTDFNLREQLAKPLFWIKMALLKKTEDKAKENY